MLLLFQGSLSEFSEAARSRIVLEYGGNAWPPLDVSTALAEWWKISVSTVTLSGFFDGGGVNEASNRPSPGGANDALLEL